VGGYQNGKQRLKEDKSGNRRYQNVGVISGVSNPHPERRLLAGAPPDRVENSLISPLTPPGGLSLHLHFSAPDPPRALKSNGGEDWSPLFHRLSPLAGGQAGGDQ
jgi:hypothetical protein